MINAVSRLLAYRGRRDLSRLLQRSRVELDVSDQYGSYAFSQLTTAEIYSPIEDYERLSRLSATDREAILSALLEVRPPRSHDVEIVNLVFRLDANAPSAATMTDDELLHELETQRNLMVSVATGGPLVKEVDGEYVTRREQIRAALKFRGLSDPNPHNSLWSWHGKWTSGDLPTYRSRRDHIGELFNPLIGQIQTGESVGDVSTQYQPTGWQRVDRAITEVRKRLEDAETEEQYQAVGLLCREALISLAQAVYDRQKHPPLDNVEPSLTDAKRMLDAYIAVELAGSLNESVRRHAKASFDLANALQHHRTAAFRQAALCSEATSAAVNIVAIVSGRRDP